MALNRVEKIDDFVLIRNIIVSVSDKQGLETFIPELLEINPEITIYSTGGTFSKIESIIPRSHREKLLQVASYTGQPEMQGGLVKTLDFKIYLGLLSETYNPSHQQDLERTDAVPMDMVVVNLYPFSETIRKQGVNSEDARANIDIGGPCMLRAAAKNFLRVAAVSSPDKYRTIIEELHKNEGSLSLATRFTLAQRTFEHTAEYDRHIADYLATVRAEDVHALYQY
jgi:phosphoribosylaminoimidazolecarboxamide formyltransferase/IMP cyclohydrolase